MAQLEASSKVLSYLEGLHQTSGQEIQNKTGGRGGVLILLTQLLENKVALSFTCIKQNL